MNEQNRHRQQEHLPTVHFPSPGCWERRISYVLWALAVACFVLTMLFWRSILQGLPS